MTAKVFAEVFGVKTEVGTATSAEDGSRIVKINDNYTEAPLMNMSFEDEEESVGKVEVAVEKVEPTPVDNAPKPSKR